MFNLNGVTIVIVDAQPKKSVRSHVEERQAAGLCLLCDCEEHKRGLCVRHYGQFRTALIQKQKKDRPGFEAQQIRNGKLLPNRQGQRPGHVNQFMEVES